MASISGSGMDRVDQTGDPRARVAYLDTATALDFVRQYKQQTFSLMAIRAGATVLDVGCGTGDDLRELAALVGPGGRVVGVDASETMLEQARARTQGLPVECRLGDAEQLGFSEASFDACRADRVLQHLADPGRAIGELARVTRAGGWVVVTEPDWDTLVIDAADAELTRRILYAGATRNRNGLVGRQLVRLIKEAGLQDVVAIGVPMIVSDWTLASGLLSLSETAAFACRRGIMVEAEAEAWLADLHERGKRGVFFSSVLAFTVAGRKP